MREDHEARQEMLDNLTKAIIDVTSKWVSVLILPSTLPQLKPLGLNLASQSAQGVVNKSNHPTANAWRRFAHRYEHCVYVVDTAFVFTSLILHSTSTNPVSNNEHRKAQAESEQTRTMRAKRRVLAYEQTE